MRTLLLALPFFLFSTGCDSMGPDRGERIEVRTISADVLAVVPDRRGWIDGAEGRRVSFRYKGEIPLACEQGNGFGYSTGPRSDAGRIEIDVTVTRDRTADVCADVTGEIEIVPLDISVGEPGTYTFAFSRLDDEPLEVTLDID